MEKVTGIGGFFFRSKDPDALAAWYSKHLGIDVVPADGASEGWKQSAGPTAFAPFAEDTEYFGDMSRGWMMNFRVADWGAMTEQLRSRGIDVTVASEDYPMGRFARLNDPEGNPIELWEPRNTR